MPEYSQDPTGQALMNIPAGSPSEIVNPKIDELRQLHSTVQAHAGQYKGLLEGMKGSGWYKPNFLSAFDAGSLDGSPESVGNAARVKAVLDSQYSDDETARQASKLLGNFMSSASKHQKAIPEQGWYDKLEEQRRALGEMQSPSPGEPQGPSAILEPGTAARTRPKNRLPQVGDYPE